MGVSVQCGAQATANPLVKGVVVSGANVLPQREIEEAFRDQAGHTLNFPAFSSAIKRLNRWYEDRGIFGQVGGSLRRSCSAATSPCRLKCRL
jgi:outer membrane protein assembly factor BamA